MPDESEGIDSSNPGDTGVSASTRRTAAAARGYTFQDVVAGACILSVFFEESDSVTIEWKLNEEDKFDDIILERDDEMTCIQVKNGPDYTLSSSDLTGSSSRGLDLDDLTESATNRVESGNGSRFVVLTSYRNEPGSGIEFADDSEGLSLLGDIEFLARKLEDGRGEVTDGIEIEFVLGVPGIGTTGDEETVGSIRRTDLFELIVENVAPRLELRENPEIDDPYDLTVMAVNLARWARNQPVDVQRLTREEIVRKLELTPSRQLPQQFPVEEGYIRPTWVDELDDAYDNPDDRVLVEGKPGSGKSTGIELLHRDWEESENQRTLRFYLYIPDDADSLERKRSDPAWFRHQLAAQIHSTFSEAFDEDTSSPVWTGVDDLQRYIDNVAAWADEEDQRILIIIDGLDHALRSFGGTTATESAEGTVLEEIGALDFPEPLSLLMVSRPLSEQDYEELRVDRQIDVPPWSSDEIREYLERNDVPSVNDFVDQMEEVSGGLPVILAHLLRKAETHEEDGQTGLQLAIDDASDVDGELEEYYETVWEPLQPYERDAVTLIALNPAGLHEETVDAMIDLPYIHESTSLEEAPLAHILDSLPGNRFRVFHDSFRAFTEDQLDPEEVRRGHEQLYNYLFDQCTVFPENLESLQYHAENGPGRGALKELATLDNVLHWWQEGVCLDLVSDTLDLAFDASLRVGDYLTAIDCVILGGVSRNMLDVYLDDHLRLTYFASKGDRERALDLVDQIRAFDGGTEEALEAMQIISQNWQGELRREWLDTWWEDYQNVDQPSWNPKAFFEVGAAVLEPDEFWELAGDIVLEDTEEHFPRAVLAAVRENPELFDSQLEPPEWLFENPSLALEACEDLIHDLPEPWREELRENAPECSSLALPALHTLISCDGPEAEILQVVENQALGEPEDEPRSGGPRFYDVYYSGSILATLGRTPDELLDAVEDMAVEQVRVQKFLALMGAATTRGSSTETERWVNATLEFLEGVLEDGSLEDSHLRRTDSWRYRQAVSTVFDAFGKVVGQGDEDLVRRVLRLSETNNSDDQLFNLVSRTLDETYGRLFPEEALPEGLDQRFEEVLKWPPNEILSEELMDLAVRAARAGFDSRAEKYAEAAVERCFRYGYHKDMFLDDVWKGLEDIAEDEWDRHLGTAIQLVNWANLLHELTDGDETHHFEGKFLESLLDAEVIDYHTAEKRAVHNTTVRTLWDWRLRNPEGMTYEELDTMIYVKETNIRSSQYSNRKLPFFSKAAQVADNFGWDDLVIKALGALNRGDYVRDGISSEDEDRLRDLASEQGVEVPDDLDPDNDSGNYEEQEDDPSDEDDRVRQILSQHSEEDPLSTEDLEPLTTEELKDAGELLQRNPVGSTRYDPTAAAPVARVLADLGEEEQAVLLLENVIAERDLIHWWLGGGHDRFVVLAETLIDLSDTDALQTVLTAWRKSRLDTMSYQGIFPQLVWIVKRAEGQTEAEKLLSHVISWMRRLMWPYEDRIQKWGSLESTS